MTERYIDYYEEYYDEGYDDEYRVYFVDDEDDCNEKSRFCNDVGYGMDIKMAKKNKKKNGKNKKKGTNNTNNGSNSTNSTVMLH